jgi:hypothetical protein
MLVHLLVQRLQGARDTGTVVSPYLVLVYEYRTACINCYMEKLTCRRRSTMAAAAST